MTDPKYETAALRERVLKFVMLELPGQPQMMHMGTGYLVSDLVTALCQRDERIKALEARCEHTESIAVQLTKEKE